VHIRRPDVEVGAGEVGQRIRSAGERDDLVSARERGGEDAAAGGTGAAENGDAHDISPKRQKRVVRHTVPQMSVSQVVS
jgi:hypothetical protein